MPHLAIVLYLGDCYNITLDAADRIRKAREEHNRQMTRNIIPNGSKRDLEWQPRAVRIQAE